MRVVPPPDFDELLGQIPPDRLLQLLNQGIQEDGRRYVSWDKLRHLKPPEGLSHEEWWFVIKWNRRSLRRPIPMTDTDGVPFVYSNTDLVLRLLHYVDQRCSGEIAMPEVVTADEQARQRYLVNSLMEEAIRSSQLEGATTSRQAAKALLRSGRQPKDRSERMIVNNYRGLQFMREEIGDQLTPHAVLELHRILTEGTLDNPDAAGRLQRPGEDRVAVFDRVDGQPIHQPPAAELLPNRLELLCDFANAQDDPESFVHPVIRAILLHFWMGYDHPFEDGNGRTARALFYWFMRTHGYWLVEYLTISNILRNAPAQYSKAFLLTETDERDTTYFLAYQLEVIQRAVEELHAYLGRKAQQIRDVEDLQKGGSDFNHRQLALLGHALRSPDAGYTFQTHAISHGVTHETARNDLLRLYDRGYLERRQTGRQYVFSPAINLPELLKRGGKRRRRTR